MQKNHTFKDLNTVYHKKFMTHALALARRGLGLVAPNPAVGCILVKDSKIVGRGWTQQGGRPHAETMALKAAGPQAVGATAYVSLEPCAHFGETGPCATALVEAGIKTVIMAVRDPDPRVNGEGMMILRAADINVTECVCRQEAEELNKGFFLTKTENRPLVTLKMATTIDGNIALSNGESQWITGPEARRFSQRQRTLYDAILVGVGTVIADNPSLTCRLRGLEDRSPVRVVLDERLETPIHSTVVRSARQYKTWIISSRTSARRAGVYEKYGVKILRLDEPRDVAQILSLLAGGGITRLLVEGGAGVHQMFLKSGLVDYIDHYQAGLLVGSDGKNAIGPLGYLHLGGVPRYMLAKEKVLGGDVLLKYAKITDCPLD